MPSGMDAFNQMVDKSKIVAGSEKKKDKKDKKHKKDKKDTTDKIPDKKIEIVEVVLDTDDEGDVGSASDTTNPENENGGSASDSTIPDADLSQDFILRMDEIKTKDPKFITLVLNKMHHNLSTWVNKTKGPQGTAFKGCGLESLIGKDVKADNQPDVIAAIITKFTQHSEAVKLQSAMIKNIETVNDGEQRKQHKRKLEECYQQAFDDIKHDDPTTRQWQWNKSFSDIEIARHESKIDDLQTLITSIKTNKDEEHKIKMEAMFKKLEAKKATEVENTVASGMKRIFSDIAKDKQEVQITFTQEQIAYLESLQRTAKKVKTAA